MIDYEWRGDLGNDEVNALHAEGFGHPLLAEDWIARLHRHSLGWVCAREGARLIGFVNVAWDGGGHAFLLDTMVTVAARNRGVATTLVSVATKHSRASGCEWLHVDFEPHLRPLYFGASGFTSTDAGLIALRP